MKAFYYLGLLIFTAAHVALGEPVRAPSLGGTSGSSGTSTGISSNDVSNSLRNKELGQAAGQARFAADKAAQDARRAAFEKKQALEDAKDREALAAAEKELDGILKDLSRKQAALGMTLLKFRNETLPKHPDVAAGITGATRVSIAGRGAGDKPAETGSVPALSKALSDSIVTFATLTIPVNFRSKPDPEPPTDNEGGNFPAAARAALQERFQEFVRNAKSLTPPDDEPIGKFAAKEADWAKPNHAFKQVCGEQITSNGVCFARFFEKASAKSALAMKSFAFPKATGAGAAGGAGGDITIQTGPPDNGTAKPKAPVGQLHMKGLNYLLPFGLDFIVETIAGVEDEAANFIRSKMMVSGLNFVAALAVNETTPGPGFQSSFDKAISQAGSGNHGDGSTLNFVEGNQEIVQGVYRRSADLVVHRAAPVAAALAEQGLEDFNAANAAELAAERKRDAQNRTVAAAKDRVTAPKPEFPEAPLDGKDLANSSGTSGSNSGGGTSGGGGSSAGGGSSGGAGGGGGGQGTKPVTFGEPAQFGKMEFGPNPEGVSPIGGTGPGNRGFTDRGALPNNSYNIPNFNFPGNAGGGSTGARTKPFGLASARGNGSGEPNLGPGTAAGSIGNKGENLAQAGGAAGGSGVPPVGKGGPEGGGGLGAVPSAGDGQGGGEDRGVTNNFVRTTEYGNGGGEGGQSGNSPESDNSDNLITAKGAPILNGKVIGNAGEIREPKVASRARGLGIMANVGAFSEFCAEPKNISVTLCSAAAGRKSAAGQAFRAPEPTVGQMVAAKISGGSASRGLTSITQ